MIKEVADAARPAASKSCHPDSIVMMTSTLDPQAKIKPSFCILFGGGVCYSNGTNNRYTALLEIDVMIWLATACKFLNLTKEKWIS